MYNIVVPVSLACSQVLHIPWYLQGRVAHEEQAVSFFLLRLELESPSVCRFQGEDQSSAIHLCGVEAKWFPSGS